MKTDSRKPCIAGRRNILRVAVSAAGIAIAGYAVMVGASEAETAIGTSEHEEAEVTPGEDLMQEHGVLERILLIYEEVARRVDHKEQVDLAVVAGAAVIVRRFVENYHEKLEEQFVFPRLQAARREMDLVGVLLHQHQRGRQVTDEILKRAGSAAGPELSQALRSFGHMYRPHAAREDTVLFPAFRKVVGRAGYRELGEQFEDKEHELFGEHGFERTVAEVARLEAALEIADLAKFTAP